jgi:hypothetical protein
VLLAGLLLGLALAGTGPGASTPAAAATVQAPEEGDPSGGSSEQPAQPDGADPTAEAESADKQAGAGVQLVGQTPWLRSGEQLHLRFRLGEVANAAAVQLVVHRRLVTRAEFTATLEGDLGSTLVSLPRQPLTGLPAGTDGNREIVQPVSVGGGAGIVVPEDGVYPVEMVVTDAQGGTLTGLTTYLLVLPTTIVQTMSVAVVMEVGGTPGLQPDGTVQPDDATVRNLNDRIDALTRAPDVPVTVAPLPETLDSLAGWEDPGRDLLDRLDQAVGRRGLISRSYVDVDIDALVNADLGGQMSPEALAGAQTVREQIGEPLAGTWLGRGTVGNAELDVLRSLGMERVIVPERAVEDVADQAEGPVPLGPVSLADGGPAAAVADDNLAAHLYEGNGQLDAQRFLAELTMIWAIRPSVGGRGVVVRIPEDATIDPAMLGTTLDALGSSGVVQPVGLDEWFNLPPAEVEGERIAVDRAPDEAAADLTTVARPLEDGQRAIGGLAATLDDRDTVQSLHRALLVALDVDLETPERLAYINRVGNVVGQLSADVNAPPEFTITLTARSGKIPLTIENNGDQAVTIAVLLQSSQLEFPGGEARRTVTVPPGGIRLDLSVRTRTSGAFPLHITLTSPDRNIVLDRTTFTIRSTAVSGAGLVLSVGAGLFLLVWWGRHWRTARRSRRLVTEGAGSGAMPD